MWHLKARVRTLGSCSLTTTMAVTNLGSDLT